MAALTNPRRLWRRRQKLGAWLLVLPMSSGLHAAIIDNVATGCTFSNGAGRPWVQVTPLTSTTPIGTVLWERGVSLNINYNFGGIAGFSHELVSAGYWSPGTPLSDGVAPTNVAGVGLKINVNSSDGKKRTIQQTPFPVAVEKQSVRYDTSGQARGSTMVTNFVQQLILTVAPNQLPGGKLIVERIAGSSQLTLYAVDLPKGQVGLGSGFDIPVSNIPLGICRAPYLLMGPAIINMGDGGGPIEIPNTCKVESYKTVSVQLGRMSLSDFPTVGSISPPRNFAIELSQCAANAKPVITFSDKYGPSADPTVLKLEPSAASAQGFGIVVRNGLTQQVVRYDGVGYAMNRVGGGAKIPLSAHYIRLGSSEALTAGSANGAAEFTFTFP